MVALDSIRLPAGMEPDQIVPVLQDFAFDTGAHDNISVIYINS
jgi:hypothetical protein